MADSAPLPENPAVANTQQPPDSDIKISQPDPSPAPSSSSPLPPPPPPPSIQPYSAVPPSFRPAAPPAPLPGVGVTPMFSPLVNPNLQQQQTSNFPNPAVQPPGVNPVPPVMIPAPTAVSASGTGTGVVQLASAPQIMPPYAVPGQMMRPFAPMPNGYPAMPQSAPQGAMLHPVS